MLFFRVFVMSVLLYQPVESLAEDKMHVHEVDSSMILTSGKLSAKPNELVLEVHGIVCSFCSVGVQKKLSKLPFVDHSKYKKGVHVAIKSQRVTMALKPGEDVDVKLVYKSVKSGGYDVSRAALGDSDGVATRYNKEGDVCDASC